MRNLLTSLFVALLFVAPPALAESWEGAEAMALYMSLQAGRAQNPEAYSYSEQVVRDGNGLWIEISTKQNGVKIVCMKRTFSRTDSPQYECFSY